MADILHVVVLALMLVLDVPRTAPPPVPAQAPLLANEPVPTGLATAPEPERATSP